MNILLLDSCTKVVQMMEKVMHYVSESNTTNWQDTVNVFIVCAAICFIVRYGVRRYFRYKICELNKQEEIDKLKRSWEVESAKTKRQNELLDKKLDILKELSYQPKKDAEKIPIQDNVNTYVTAIDEALKKI